MAQTDQRHREARTESMRLANELPRLAEKLASVRERMAALTTTADELDDKGLSIRVGLLKATFDDILSQS